MEYVLADIGATIVIFILLALITWVGFTVYLILRKKLESETAVYTTVAILLIALTSHYIYYRGLFLYYDLQSNNITTSTLIEYPESVYIVDPTLNSYRRVVIKKYLDGIHLKTIAFQNNDGTISVYKADENTSTSYRNWWEERRLKSFPMVDTYSDTVKNFDTIFKDIWNNVDIIEDISSIPSLNYHIRINELKRSTDNPAYYSDTTIVIEQLHGKTIASSTRQWSYNTRFNKLFFNAGRYGVKSGQGPYKFLEKVIFTYPQAMYISPGTFTDGLNNR